MFEFKTDFFDRRRVDKIEQIKPEQTVQLEQTSQQPGPQEYEAVLPEPFVMESDIESRSLSESDQPDIDLLAEPEDVDQPEDQSNISGVQVFYHPGKACVNIFSEGVVQDCSNTPVVITGLTSGVIAKVPVVLAELAVQVNMHSTITLPERALEIKEIKKRLKLTQCLLLQDPEELIPPVLFLKGFVRKNISFASSDCANDQGVCGDIRHCTADVPFTCTTQVEFNGADPILPVVNTVSEFEFFRRQPLPNRFFAEKDELLSGDFSEINQVTHEFYNELPYCELVSSRIVEYDEFINRSQPSHDLPIEEREFSQIEEKMVVYITIKVLQKQQVRIPPFMSGFMQTDPMPEIMNQKALEESNPPQFVEAPGYEENVVTNVEPVDSILPVRSLELSRADYADELECNTEDTFDSTPEVPVEISESETVEPEPFTEKTSDPAQELPVDFSQPETVESEPSTEIISDPAQELPMDFSQPGTSDEEHKPPAFDHPKITCPFKRT
ncbi:MAG: CsxC family protein [Bacillota bacterium]